MKKALIVSSKSKDAYKKVSHAVRAGSIIIAPTETVYGFATSAFNVLNHQKIYKIKGRSYKKPLVIMVGDIEAAKPLVDIPEKALEIAKRFWPGQLTLIFPTTELGKILSGGRDDLGVRIPDHKFMLKLLNDVQMPLWTTSVNVSNKKSAKTFKETLLFEKKVDIIVDGGDCKYSYESTVIDMVKFPYVILRKGCLPTDEILKYI
ncbi:MAG: threonylcarbamoyl-AMP synthase [Elusimicrobiota bacterium]|jgi:L-threonylcarbamoyladenylate synthase|nr:threonylcarbamoyl-AMP synthase [Elusimicrobiota bacterium]